MSLVKSVKNDMLTSSSESEIIWSQDENLEVHHFAESALNDGVNALEHNDRCSADSFCFFGSLVQSEIISGDLTVLARNELV